MIQAFFLKLFQWVMTAVVQRIAKWLSDYLERKKEQAALEKNKKALAEALKSGDKDAIKKAAENSLNNSGS